MELQKPVIELTSIHTNERMSEETTCFSACLIINGKIAGEVLNRGNGGCNEYHLKGWDERELNDLVKATYPKWTFPAEWNMKGEQDADLDHVINEMVENIAAVKKIRRAFKNKIVLKTGKRNVTQEISYKGCKALTAAHWDAFKKAHPTRVADVMNNMTDEQILAALEGK